METLFPDLPAALDGAWELGQKLDFTLADLGYRFPEYPLPPGETAASYLRQITWNGARSRFRIERSDEFCIMKHFLPHASMLTAHRAIYHGHS